jgi:O-antigen/teichoic acid export membrane protein
MYGYESAIIRARCVLLMTGPLNRTLARLLGQVRGDGLRVHLVRGALGSAGVQAASRVLALLLGIILARALGPEGYGVYAYAFAIMSLLMVVAEAGIPTLLMRELAATLGLCEWGLMRGAMRRGLQLVAVASTTVSAAGLILLALFADMLPPANFQTMAVMLLVLPAAAMAKTVAHALRGLHKVVTAQALEGLLRPLLVIGLVGALFLFSPELRRPWVAMAGQLAAVVTAVVVAAILLKRSIPAAAQEARLEFQSRQWLKSALPFTLIGAALVINNQTDIVMLGWFTTDGQRGRHLSSRRAGGHADLLSTARVPSDPGSLFCKAIQRRQKGCVELD